MTRGSARQEHRSVAEALDLISCKVQHAAEILQRGEAVGLGADFDDPSREAVIDAGQAGQGARGSVVDIDQASIDCARLIGSADADLTCERWLLARELQRLIAIVQPLLASHSRRHKPHRSNRGAGGWADDRLATREGAADVCEDVGRRPATVQKARALLGL
jgi:hypothetical protein